MNLVFADPGLQNNLGHHANSCRHIVFEARRRGIPSAVLAYKQIEPFLRDELLATPWFRCHAYGTYDTDPICGWLSNFDFVANLTHEDLSCLHGVGREDLIFFNSAGPGQLMALLRWIQAMPMEQRPTVIVEFGLYAGLVPKETPNGTEYDLCYQGDPRPTLLRYVARKQLTPVDNSWLKLATFDARASSIYEKVFDFPVQALPLSNRAVTGCRDRTGVRPVTVAFLGHQRGEKGFGLVPELAGRLL
ncbi:MAG: glycosyltransferase family 1 protein, partial [Alphaproteobacteria bacterium]